MRSESLTIRDGTSENVKNRCLKLKQPEGWRFSSGVKFLPSIQETLGLIPRTAKTNCNTEVSLTHTQLAHVQLAFTIFKDS